jgi:hypothetical protein
MECCYPTIQVKAQQAELDYGKILPLGGMTERLKVTVLKTVVVKATVGSNPTPSADRHPGINHPWGGAREADWARLLSECRGLNLGRGFESRPPRQNKNASNTGAFFANAAGP